MALGIYRITVVKMNVWIASYHSKLCDKNNVELEVLIKISYCS